jgi:hypothetical protein
MGKSIFHLFTSRKERKDRSSAVADSSEHIVHSKLPRSRHSITAPVPLPPGVPGARRKTLHGSAFFTSKFASKRRTSRAQTASEASTVPCNSYKDGGFDPEGIMELKEDALLGTAVGLPAALSPSESLSQNQAETPDCFSDDSEDPLLIVSYNSIPVLEQTKLPRGGVSIETKAVGRVQVCV